MEFSGDEKRIQALFSELSLEHQSRTPRFEKLWRRAEANAAAPLVRRSALASVTAAILVASVSIATWSWYRTSASEHAGNIPPQTIPTTSESRVTPPGQLLSVNSKELRPLRPRRVMRQRQSGSAAIRQAELISNWQSPTSTLLNSPTASFLSSLPQLTSSVRDLEQFLPKNNEIIKESKQ
jgi:hypothetical protein